MLARRALALRRLPPPRRFLVARLSSSSPLSRPTPPSPSPAADAAPPGAVRIYHRDISRTILKGSVLLFTFDGIVAVSTYDVFWGAFGRAAREQMPSLYMLVQLTSGITFFFGAVIGLRWVAYCLGAVRDIHVLPAPGKMALQVRAHNVAGLPSRPQVYTFDDFSVGDFSSLGKPDDPFFTLPVKGRNSLVVYTNSFTNPTGKALVEAAGRANRIEFAKRFNMLV